MIKNVGWYLVECPQLTLGWILWHWALYGTLAMPKALSKSHRNPSAALAIAKSLGCNQALGPFPGSTRHLSGAGWQRRGSGKELQLFVISITQKMQGMDLVVGLVILFNLWEAVAIAAGLVSLTSGVQMQGVTFFRSQFQCSVWGQWGGELTYSSAVLESASAWLLSFPGL